MFEDRIEITPAELIIDKSQGSDACIVITNNNESELLVRWKCDNPMLHCSPLRLTFTGSQSKVLEVKCSSFIDNDTVIELQFYPFNSSPFFKNINVKVIGKKIEKPVVVTVPVGNLNLRSDSTNCCKICWEPYDEVARIPRIMKECGHTLCEICVKDLMKRSGNSQILCPFDRTKIAVGGASITSLPKNFTVLEMIQALPKRSQEPSGTSPSDHPCAENPYHEAVIFCESCNADFCEKCFDQVHTPKVLSNHRKSPLAEKSITPLKSSEKSLRSYENQLLSEELIRKIQLKENVYHQKLESKINQLNSYDRSSQEYQRKIQEISDYFKILKLAAMEKFESFLDEKLANLREEKEELENGLQNTVVLKKQVIGLGENLEVDGIFQKIRESLENCEEGEGEQQVQLGELTISWRNGTEFFID